MRRLKRLAAALATDFAVSDGRVAAATRDPDHWNWAGTFASLGWMTGTADGLVENVSSSGRLRLIRQSRCPVLVIAGCRRKQSSYKLSARQRAFMWS